MVEIIYQWYILFVQGGKEEKVITDIKTKLEWKDNNKWQNNIRDLKLTKSLKNHIFCYCSLTPELVKFLSRIEGVVSFLNYENEKNATKLPVPVSGEVISHLFSNPQSLENNSFLANSFSSLKVGDLVKITNGVFANYEGRISHLDANKKKAKIIIENMRWEITDIPVSNCQKSS